MLNLESMLTFTVVGTSDVSAGSSSARIVVSTFIDVDTHFVGNFESIETVALETCQQKVIFSRDYML
jgi:hypothetical protein